MTPPDVSPLGLGDAFYFCRWAHCDPEENPASAKVTAEEAVKGLDKS